MLATTPTTPLLDTLFLAMAEVSRQVSQSPILVVFRNPNVPSLSKTHPILRGKPSLGIYVAKMPKDESNEFSEFLLFATSLLYLREPHTNKKEKGQN